jgi:hypothetical protein
MGRRVSTVEKRQNSQMKNIHDPLGKRKEKMKSFIGENLKP